MPLTVVADSDATVFNFMLPKKVMEQGKGRGFDNKVRSKVGLGSPWVHV